MYGNGTTTAYAYDEISLRPTRIHTTRTSDGVSVQDLRYVYDAVGNIVEVDDLAQQSVFFANAQVSPRQRYTYDALYQLATAAGREHTSQGQVVSSELMPGVLPDTNDPAALRAWTETYSYDAVGNIVEVQHVAAGGNWTRAYVYDAASNRLLSNAAPGDPAGGPYSHAYAYDAHGNMTAMPHLAAIDWDYADRMQHADLGGGGDVWFVYDSAGNRVRKVRVNQAGTQSEERVYLGGVELYRERQAGVLQRERESLHVADDSGRVCLVETLTVDAGAPVAAAANVSRYQYGNHLGSASLELDGAANTISYEEYHPFGKSAYRAVDSTIAVSAKRYRYTGRERDEETGLDLMGARYYASWLGRWTAADPIGLGDGVNRYAYVSNRPVNLVDPSGASAESGWFDSLAKPVSSVAKGVVSAAAGTLEIAKEGVAVASKKAAAVSNAAEARAAAIEEGNFVAVRVEPQRTHSFGQYSAVRRPTTGYTGGIHAARGDGKGRGRPTNTDSHGHLYGGPSHTSQVPLVQSLVPVAGPLYDAIANFKDLGEAQTGFEALSYGALGVANGAFAIADVFSLGAANRARLALRAAGTEVVYTGGKESGKHVGRKLAEAPLEPAGGASRAAGGGTRFTAEGARRTLRSELGDDIIRESEVFFVGSSSGVPRIGPDSVQPGPVFSSATLDIAETFAIRKTGRVPGEPNITAVVIDKADFARLRANGLVRTKPIDDMPGKIETIFEPGVLEQLADFIPIPRG